MQVPKRVADAWDAACQAADDSMDVAEDAEDAPSKILGKITLTSSGTKVGSFTAAAIVATPNAGAHAGCLQAHAMVHVGKPCSCRHLRV
jgi:hypothetical protein